MENIKFIEIENEREIELFIDKIEYFTHVRLPKSYVNNSKIVGAFLQDKMVGGYMLVTKPQFRSLMFVPDHVKSSHPFFQNDTYEMLEVNGVWMGPAIKSPKLQFRFWMKLLFDVLMAKKKYLLLMSNLKNRNIEYLHSLSNPEILYQGSPSLMVGDISHEMIRVGYTTRMNALLNIPRYWRELKNRELRAKNFDLQRKYTRALDLNIEFSVTNTAQ